MPLPSVNPLFLHLLARRHFSLAIVPLKLGGVELPHTSEALFFWGLGFELTVTPLGHLLFMSVKRG